MKHIKIYILIAMFAMAACTNEGDSYLDLETPVVEGYLFVDSDFDHFRLSKAIPYTEDGTGEKETIDNAEVKLTVDGNEFYLTPMGDTLGSYILLDTSMTVTPGMQAAFEFEMDGVLVSATTSIPEKPQSISVSPSYISLEKIESTSTPTTTDDETIEVSWENNDSSYFYVKMECMEDDPEFVNERIEEMMEEDEDFDIEEMKSQVSRPERTNIFNLRSRQIVFFGTYRIVVYHINDEYANLFEQLDNSSNSITEPQTNIVNGKGIFTGVATDTLYFDVYEE